MKPQVAQPDTGTLLGKVARLLQCLASDELGAALGLSELSRASGVSKATTFRLAEELTLLGVLERVAEGYRLGPLLFELGDRVPRFHDIAHVAAPFAEDLHRVTRQTVHVAVLDGDEILYLLKVRGTQGIDKPSRVAGRLPAHCTASGRALLAMSDPAILQSILAHGLNPLTRHTIVHPPLLLRRIEEVRRTGVATEMEEVALGHGAVASPVMGRSGPIAAIGVAVSVGEGRLDQFRTAVRTTALHLSRVLEKQASHA